LLLNKKLEKQRRQAAVADDDDDEDKFVDTNGADMTEIPGAWRAENMELDSVAAMDPSG
jgi:hypothetical protein